MIRLSLGDGRIMLFKEKYFHLLDKCQQSKSLEGKI